LTNVENINIEFSLRGLREQDSRREEGPSTKLRLSFEKRIVAR